MLKIQRPLADRRHTKWLMDGTKKWTIAERIKVGLTELKSERKTTSVFADKVAAQVAKIFGIVSTRTERENPPVVLKSVACHIFGAYESAIHKDP